KIRGAHWLSAALADAILNAEDGDVIIVENSTQRELGYAAKDAWRPEADIVFECDSVEVGVSLLLDLKTAIIEAIVSEDGLDGAQGSYLLSELNILLSKSESDLEVVGLSHQVVANE
ncbi:hypothetical protein LCGC14_2075590, partial [marine sediment metagenome]